MYITDKAGNQYDDRYFYFFEEDVGKFHFFQCTKVVSEEILMAKKCVTSKAAFGGNKSKDLDWGKVGVFKFEDEFEDRERAVNKDAITGKAVVVFGHIFTVSEPVRQET